jgi:hypothetical protein
MYMYKILYTKEHNSEIVRFSLIPFLFKGSDKYNLN